MLIARGVKSGIRQSFDRAAASYDQAADVQRRAVAGLAALALDPEVREPHLIVDAGCGTGFAAPLLRARWPQADIVALDLAERMLLQLRGSGDTSLPLAGDIERLPLADACADLYWSSFSLQWCHLGRALAEARRVLKPGGRLAFATVTAGTFDELRQAFAGVDDYAHTLDFLAADAVRETTAAAGFGAIATRSERLVARYPDLRSLLDAVRQVGASGVSGRRRPGLLGKTAWQRIATAFPRDPASGTLLLGYEVLYLSARS